ncbi:MAG TPA: SLC13 family permease [Pirellulales bacterium]|nr:SLC13 family permease [Pirellulales bacterium]
MNWQAGFTLFVLGGVLASLIFTAVGPDLALIGGLIVLMMAGILTPAQMVHGLSNEGLVTVAVLYVVSAGMRETGAIDLIAMRVLGRPKTTAAAIARLLIPVTAISAFVNNTPLVAMLIPVVNDWAKRQQIAASKLMIPLSYAAILGGTCSLIGTSTNLVVDGLYIKSQGTGLAMFEVSKVGIPAAIAGCAFIMLTAKWLLPDRRPAISHSDDPRSYTAEMLVAADSPLVGKSIEDAGRVPGRNRPRWPGAAGRFASGAIARERSAGVRGHRGIGRRLAEDARARAGHGPGLQARVTSRCALLDRSRGVEHLPPGG